VSDNRDWLAKLIANNANVYYSIDGGLPFYGWLEQHQGKAVPKEESLPYAKSQFNVYLEQDIERYKSLIEAYPNRFLRGTDRYHLPHFDREVSALMEEYSRAFIGRLAPSVQEKFAYKNAEALLKK
jgi:glutathionylspermidine synthase